MTSEKREMLSQFNNLLHNVEYLRVLRRKFNRLEEDQRKYANKHDLNLKPLETSVIKVKAEMFDLISKVHSWN